MRFSLPGQLKGPECKRAIQQAVALRKKLEPWFEALTGGDVEELALVLRVNGSLGSFGPEGVENVVIEDRTIECDVVIADQGWANLADEEIATIIKGRVLEAVDYCLAAARIPYDDKTLAAAAV